MRTYIAGPMTGLPKFNHPAFDACAARLRARGLQVENPAENTPPACDSWVGWMRLALAQLIRCDAVHMLPGWQASRGARIEHDLARSLGLHVTYESEAKQ